MQFIEFALKCADATVSHTRKISSTKLVRTMNFQVSQLNISLFFCFSHNYTQHALILILAVFKTETNLNIKISSFIASATQVQFHSKKQYTDAHEDMPFCATTSSGLCSSKHCFLKTCLHECDSRVSYQLFGILHLTGIMCKNSTLS